MFFERRACLLPLLAVALLTGACSTSRHVNSVVDYVPQRATPVRESAIPRLDAARAAAAKADIQASRSADAVDRALNDGQAVKLAGGEAAREVADLMKKNATYAVEFRGLLSKLREQDSFTDQVIRNISAAKESLAQERLLRQQAQEDLAAARVQVAGKEDESSRLREQLAQEQAVAASLRTTAEKNASAANANADKAASVKGESALKSKLLAGTAVLALVELFVIVGLARFKLLP